jgi:predicted dehydrogenase
VKPGVLLVGLGAMGMEHARVLRDLAVPSLCVGRSAARASAFAGETGMEAMAGGVAELVAARRELPGTAIVCVPVDQTAATVRELLDAGVERILVEKPGGASADELERLAADAERRGASVAVAYNRRFYASVREARSRIAAQGGVESFHFEFTERERDALAPKFGAAVRRHWGLANSSHVIDLAFFLGGEPERITSEVAGELPWHPAGSRFAGCGVTRHGALFSYCANWGSGGRWSVELMTRESRLILRPLEELRVQERGSFGVAEVPIDDDLDRRFKPGLHRQTAAFLEHPSHPDLVTLGAQAGRARSIFGRLTGEE